MPLEGGAPAPTEPTTEAPVETPPTEEAIHPAWEKAMEAVPEIIRGPLVEQIRRSDAEAKKAIETARSSAGADIDPAWREFITDSTNNGISPNDLVESWNNLNALQQAMLEDPDGFMDDLNNQLNQMVAAGQITRRQAQQVQGDAVAELQTPEMQEIAALKQQIQQNEQRWADVDQAATQQQINEAVEDYSRSFLEQINGAFVANGLGQIPAESKLGIAQIAASLLDSNERLTEDQGIKIAIDRYKVMVGAPASAPAAPGAPPVGGGSQALPAQTNKFHDYDEREAAMLAEARRQAALG